MASKRFRSNTGYPVTVSYREPSGNSRSIRIDTATPFETDDKQVIKALEASPEIHEIEPRSDQKPEVVASRAEEIRSDQGASEDQIPADHRDAPVESGRGSAYRR